jgi:perosamine synthetase
MAKKLFDEADLAALQRVLASGNLSSVDGTLTEEFEAQVARRYGCRHAIAIHSAMAGLQLALMAAGVGEGDEVVCDPMVPFGAYAALYLHARPVFADVERDTYNIDPASLRERLTERTKALVVTHLYGLPARMEAIMAIAQARKLAVIEDCAHALFAERQGRLAGTFGTAGVFSFQQSKHLATGDGGLLITDDNYIADQIRGMLRFGALAPRLSWNFRINELTAAVAGVQWGRAEGYVAEDRCSADLYTQAVASSRAVTVQAADPEALPSYHLWGATYEGERTLGVSQADFQRFCAEEGARVSFGYIGVPLYLHPQFHLGGPFGYQVWRDAGATPYRRGYCPVAEDLMPRLLLVGISTQDREFHRRNAEALGKAVRRAETP